MDHEDDDPGTTWNADARKRDRRPDVAARRPGAPSRRRCRRMRSSRRDIGNNCAIGNAYPTFEQGRKYLAPGLFGPCGYGFPAIVGAKIGCPDMPVVGFAGDGAFGISMSEMTLDRPQGVAGDHHGDLPQLPVGRGEAQLDLWYDDNFVGTELDPRAELRQGRRGPAG